MLASWDYCEVYSARPRAGIPRLFDGKFNDPVLYWQLARDRREKGSSNQANLASPSPKETKKSSSIGD